MFGRWQRCCDGDRTVICNDEVNSLTTPEQHNKYLAYTHIGYGAFSAVIMILVMIMFGLLSAFDRGGPPAFFFFFMAMFMLVMGGLMTAPSLIAGYGLLKRKKWARTMAIISGVIAAGNFPFGTAACVYTFWFLFSDPGKVIFEGNNYALPPGRQTWANQQLDYDAQRQREAQYNAPPPPPDWR